MEKRLLITGFDPFGDHKENPSFDAAEQLPGEVGGFTLKKACIPTVYGKGAQKALAAAAEFQPHVILCIGLAAGRTAVTPERIGVNIRDARIGDNEGVLYRGERISAKGPAAWFSTVPVTAMADAIAAEGIPAAVSNSAGTFVCNDVLYTLLDHYAGTQVKVGFIHVPDKTDLPLTQITAALSAAIGACAEG